MHADEQEIKTIQHLVFRSFSDKIVKDLCLEPKDIAIRLLSAGLISERVYDETLELNEIKRDKAARLYSAVRNVVRDDPDKFDHFLSILQTEQDLHKELIQELNTAILCA